MMDQIISGFIGKDNLIKVLSDRDQACSTCEQDSIDHLHLIFNEAIIEDPFDKIPKLSKVTCDHCAKCGPDLMACSGCNSTFYCGIRCQKVAWFHHRKRCQNLRNGFNALPQHQNETHNPQINMTTNVDHSPPQTSFREGLKEVLASFKQPQQMRRNSSEENDVDYAKNGSTSSLTVTPSNSNHANHCEESIFEPKLNHRIIHLNLNPLSEKTKELEEYYNNLIDQNNKLTAKLRSLETGQACEMSRIVNEDSKNEVELEKMKQQLISSEKKQLLMTEAFKKTSSDFREVVYILTGYKIDALKQKIYRLAHVYADSPNDELYFSYENGSIKLLKNGYSEKLTDLLETYLDNHDSFPAFLGALTLELFKKQTHYIFNH